MLSDEALDVLFRRARSHSHWQSRALTNQEIQDIYELTKWGPTSANSSPARFVFLHSAEAKARLLPYLLPGNVEKVRTSPVTVIIGYDLEFYQRLPKLFPHTDARSWFAGKPAVIEINAFRNSALQGAYFMVAARALGFDCGPMSGFDNAKVDAEFFPDSKIKTNFLCALGHGDASKLHPRNPRLSFAEACRIL